MHCLSFGLFSAPSVIPTNVTATPIGTTSINLTWVIRGLERGFILQSFVVSYRALKNGTWGDAVKKHVPINETSESFQGQQVFTKEYAIIEGLDVFTKYEIKMAAHTANLTGNFSRPINVTTKEGGNKFYEVLESFAAVYFWMYRNASTRPKRNIVQSVALHLHLYIYIYTLKKKKKYIYIYIYIYIFFFFSMFG